jgi:selenocysteine lyase/cysteine desulfurase
MFHDISAGQFFDRFESNCDALRREFAMLIGGEEEKVALMPSASIAIYQAASTLPFTQRPIVVTSAGDFPAVSQVISGLRQQGAYLRYAGRPNAPADAHDFRNAIDNRCELVTIELINYRDGSRAPWEDVVTAARAAGARILIDAYQALGVEAVDVKELDCDYLVGGTMKYLLGLPGLGFLYTRDPKRSAAQPRLTGWLGRSKPFAPDPRDHDLPDEARRLETGTPSAPAVYSALAGLGLIDELNVAVTRRHVESLVGYAIERLRSAGESIAGPLNPSERGAHVAVLDRRPDHLAHWLRERRVLASPRGDVLRLAMHGYVTVSDIDATCDLIAEFRKVQKRTL